MRSVKTFSSAVAQLNICCESPWLYYQSSTCNLRPDKACCHSCYFTHFLLLWADLPTLYIQTVKTTLSVTDPSVSSHRKRWGWGWWQSCKRVSEWGRWTLSLTRGILSKVCIQTTMFGWNILKLIVIICLFHSVAWTCIFRQCERPHKEGKQIITGWPFICFGHNCPHRDSRVAERGCPVCVHYYHGV